ncbi:hypothetical protein KKF32_03125 [Patescibacteria group bacterium]|nr:hypothetical protein [Patescibacteria group bacterium]
MSDNHHWQKVNDIFKQKKAFKPPAYPWQELALQVIEELNIPNFKKNAVFKVCKDYPKSFIERCLNDTKELCQTGKKWQYFFKLVNKENKK